MEHKREGVKREAMHGAGKGRGGAEEGRGAEKEKKGEQKRKAVKKERKDTDKTRLREGPGRVGRPRKDLN